MVESGKVWKNTHYDYLLDPLEDGSGFQLGKGQDLVGMGQKPSGGTMSFRVRNFSQVRVLTLRAYAESIQNERVKTNS